LFFILFQRCQSGTTMRLWCVCVYTFDHALPSHTKSTMSMIDNPRATIVVLFEALTGLILASYPFIKALIRRSSSFTTELFGRPVKK